MMKTGGGSHSLLRKPSLVGLLAIVLVITTLSVSTRSASALIATPQVAAKNLTAPTATSVASLYASNWSNLTSIWMASKLNQNDTGSFGPRIAELHSSSNWSTNQIVDYSGFFQDTTNSTKYDQIHNFNSSAYLDENGVVNSTYGTYSGAALSIQIKRDYVAVPNQPFLVVRYTLTNPSLTSSVNWKVLDQVHLNNTSATTNVSDSFSSSAPGFFNTPGVLYEDATIFASGASHIELGDVDHMLDQPNYLNWNLDMPAALQQSMVSYYNFLTAYENLLRDGLSDSSNAISFPGGPATSTSATAGTVWTFARAKTGTDVLHFINMLNLTSVDWMDTNATQPAPTVKANVAVKYYYTSSTSPSSVRFASPDVNGGTARSLSFSTGTDGGGHYVIFTLPTLNYWDMAWVTY